MSQPSGAGPNHDCSNQVPHHQRLVVCCEGTGKNEHSGSKPSNVSMISRCLAAYDLPEHAPDEGPAAHGVRQIIYSLPGIGADTGNSGNSLDKAFGNGIDGLIMAAYAWLCNNYACSSDEIFLIGYSRGAFIARCLAQFTSDVGFLTKPGLKHLKNVFKLWKGFKEDSVGERPQPEQLGITESDLRSDVRIKACALYDTVAAVGKNLAFVHSGLSDNVEFAFQALSLHEHRKDFTHIAMKATRDSNTRLEQCWFAGYHGDIGGGRKEGTLSHFALLWIISKLSEHRLLKFNMDNLIVEGNMESTWKIEPRETNTWKWKLTRGSRLRRPKCQFWTRQGLIDEAPYDAVQHESTEKMHVSMRLVGNPFYSRSLSWPSHLGMTEQADKEHSRLGMFPRSFRWKRESRYIVEEEAPSNVELDYIIQWLGDEQRRAMEQCEIGALPPVGVAASNIPLIMASFDRWEKLRLLRVL